ncbi:MAG: Uma2 family endonuclease [Acidobacteria bacterium]|nr:Uma2 family endonuclease [Acidobacteriota bacterium]
MKNLKRIIEPVLTIADLDAMPDDGNRYELIEGAIYMSRSPTNKHQSALHYLQFDLESFLRESPVGILRPGLGVIFDDFNGVIPDLIFISNERIAKIATSERVYGTPDLVVEILSPGAENEKRDRSIKRQLYGLYKVREYWIVDTENRTIQVYKLRKRGLELAATFGIEDELTSTVLKGLRLKLSSIFRER